MFYVYGVNQYNVDCKNGTIHAEVDALLKLEYQLNLKKVDILVFRTNKSGKKLMNAKPCCNCISQILRIFKKKNYKTSRIYYTNEIGEINFIKLNKYI